MPPAGIFLVPARKIRKKPAWGGFECLAPARQATSPRSCWDPRCSPCLFGCVAHRSLPLIRVASSATGGAPLIPPSRRALSMVQTSRFPFARCLGFENRCVSKTQKRTVGMFCMGYLLTSPYHIKKPKPFAVRPAMRRGVHRGGTNRKRELRLSPSPMAHSLGTFLAKQESTAAGRHYRPLTPPRVTRGRAAIGRPLPPSIPAPTNFPFSIKKGERSAFSFFYHKEPVGSGVFPEGAISLP